MRGNFLLDTNIIIAFQQDLSLVSRDNDFAAIDGLRWVVW